MFSLIRWKIPFFLKSQGWMKGHIRTDRHQELPARKGAVIDSLCSSSNETERASITRPFISQASDDGKAAICMQGDLELYLLSNSHWKGPLHLSMLLSQKRYFTLVSSNLFCSVNFWVFLSNFMKIRLMSVNWCWLSWFKMDSVKWKRTILVWWLDLGPSGNQGSAWCQWHRLLGKSPPVTLMEDSVTPETFARRKDTYSIRTRRRFASETGKLGQDVHSFIHQIFSKHLLCVRLCLGLWRTTGEWNKASVLMKLLFWGQ